MNSALVRMFWKTFSLEEIKSYFLIFLLIVILLIFICIGFLTYLTVTFSVCNIRHSTVLLTQWKSYLFILTHMNILKFEYASNGILSLLNGILCLLFPDIKTPGLDVEDAKIKKRRHNEVCTALESERYIKTGLSNKKR